MITRQIKKYLGKHDVNYVELYFSSGNSVIVKKINDKESTEECVYATDPVPMVINLKKSTIFSTS